ncbi:MAG: response regulator [Bacteroidota bacterium]|nr:response regulator [Bacteroidota bacterium]
MIILIADSSAHIIDRLESMLAETTTRASVYKALSYKEAARICSETMPDVVLLDISFPGNMSLVLLEKIRGAGYKTCVIILFIHIDNNTREQCKSLGADFFLDKHHEFEKIPGIINELAAAD